MRSHEQPRPHSTPPSSYQWLKQRLRAAGKYPFAIAFVLTYLAHANSVERGVTRTSGGAGDAGDAAHVPAGGRLRHTTSRSAWTASHSPHPALGPRVRVAFRLHDPADVPRPDAFLSVAPYKCGDDKAALPPALAARPVLGFTTTVATDLKIVHVGDSLGQQFAQGFDAAVLGAGYGARRQVLREYFYEGRVYSHNCLSVAAPVRGGGISAYWRVTDLLSEAGRRKAAACAKEELQAKQRAGWSMEQALALVEHRYAAPPRNGTRAASAAAGDRASTDDDNATFPVGPFDAAVLRIPHGWMDVPDITRARLVEAIALLHDNLGARTVVVTTLPLNNNVRDAAAWRGIHAINALVRDIARTWAPAPGRGVQWVLVQEFGAFTNRILWESARHLGYPLPDAGAARGDGWELAGTDFLLHRLPWAKHRWPPSIPMVCAKRPAAGDKDCRRNRISTDGIHWCVETLGPRYAASVACLLGCVHNGGPGRAARVVRRCERECNGRLMSLRPADGAWLREGTTVFAD